MPYAKFHRFLVFLSLILVWVTGLVWLMADERLAAGWLPQTGLNWLARLDLPGLIAPGPLAAWHGASAFLALLILGSVFSAHLPGGLRARQRVFSGLLLVTLACTLTLTGYGLYYGSEEGLRPLADRLHQWLGLLAPLILLPHALRRGEVRRFR